MIPDKPLLTTPTTRREVLLGGMALAGVAGLPLSLKAADSTSAPRHTSHPFN